MIYTGLNENESAKITKILDEFKAVYEVSVHEEAVQRIENLSDEEREKFRRLSKRSGQSLMQIEIELAEFKKISALAKDRLHALGIYEEVESPFTEEDFNAPAVDSKKPVDTSPIYKAKQIVILAFFVLFILFMLFQRGF